MSNYTQRIAARKRFLAQNRERLLTENGPCAACPEPATIVQVVNRAGVQNKVCDKHFTTGMAARHLV
jgi:hypothetical protein